MERGVDGGAEEAADEEALQGLAVLGVCFFAPVNQGTGIRGFGKREAGNMRQDCQTEDGGW